jgi:hypothetical protein
MSDLETEAQPLVEPLIMGQARELDAGEQLLVATWAVKTAMVFDLTRRHDRIHFSQRERECLFSARAQGGLGIPFPEHTWVWLAAYGGVDCSCYCHATSLRGVGEQRPSGRRELVHGHVATISGGALVAQVLVTRLPPGTPNRQEFYYDACGAKWERAVVRIRPPLSRRAGWPPQMHLDDGDLSLDRFALRWPAEHNETGGARP